MPFTNFNDVTKQPLPDGRTKLVASGPLSLPWPRQLIEGKATIRILMIEDPADAAAAGHQPGRVDYSGTFEIPTDLQVNEEGREWAVEIPEDDFLPPGSNIELGTYRVIGQVVLVRRNPPDPDHPNDPPLFENLTWCVTRKVVAA